MYLNVKGSYQYWRDRRIMLPTLCWVEHRHCRAIVLIQHAEQLLEEMLVNLQETTQHTLVSVCFQDTVSTHNICINVGQNI